jgi:hypothetical protein
MFPAPAADQTVAQWCFNGVLIAGAFMLVGVFGPARLSHKPASGRAVVDRGRSVGALRAAKQAAALRAHV